MDHVSKIASIKGEISIITTGPDTGLLYVKDDKAKEKLL